MRAFLDELLAAARGLARAPAFTALAVGVLALGLGAATFMYGVANTLLLKPPPYPAAERIYLVELHSERTGEYRQAVPLPDYEQLRAAQTSFEAFGASYTGTVYLGGDGQTERYDGTFATAEVFAVTGIGPQLGRLIEPRDRLPGAVPVVLLSHELWRERFGSDPGIVGRRVRLNGAEAEVIGVMPAGYTFPVHSALWLPDQREAATLDREEAIPVQIYGRLRPGVAPDQAVVDLAPVAARITAAHPGSSWNGNYELRPIAAATLDRDDARLVTMLVAAVGFILLIACANVSNLLLARSAWRVRATTMRAALGATRGRLLAQVLVESLLINGLALVAGLLLAALALDGFAVIAGPMIENRPPWWAFEIDAGVFAVAAGAALAASLVAGLPAALRASRPALDALLRDGGRAGTGLAIGRIAGALVVFEVLLASVVLGGAVLMTRGVLAITNAEVGVPTAELMTARIGLTAGTYPEPERQLQFWTALLERIREQPAIESAGLTTRLPMHPAEAAPIEIEGRAVDAAVRSPEVGSVTVSPSLLATLRLEPRQGRLFGERDRADSLPVALVSESLARRLWPDGQALGARVRSAVPEQSPWYTIVGVVPDVRMLERDRPQELIYRPLAQNPARFMSIVVRGPVADPRTLAPALRTALARTDPDLALYFVRPLDETIRLRTAGLRIIGTMFTLFAALALTLAAAGLYGVLAFQVGQRTRELGLRRALGADDGRILRLVAGASGGRVLAGAGLGFLLLPFLGRGLGQILPGLSAWDPVSYGLVLAVLLAVAALATLAPALRALGIDPAAALRYE